MRPIDADALKNKAFGKRRGLVHTSDIDAMPTLTMIEMQSVIDLLDRMHILGKGDVNAVLDEAAERIRKMV